MKYSHSAALKAAHWHKDQKYGDHSYMYHLNEVAELAAVSCKNKLLSEQEIDLIVTTCWLHDILEDTDVTEQELFECFPADVVMAVKALTKDKRFSYGYYIEQVRSIDLARIVKVFDTTCNLRNSVIEGNIGRINKYTKQLQLLVAD